MFFFTILSILWATIIFSASQSIIWADCPEDLTLLAKLRKSFSNVASMVGPGQIEELDWIAQEMSVLKYPTDEQDLIYDQIFRGNIKLGNVHHALRLAKRDRRPFRLAHAISSDPTQALYKKVLIKAESPSPFAVVSEAESDAFTDLHFPGIRKGTGDPRTVLIFESPQSHVFPEKKNVEKIILPGLTQCRATFVFNIDNGKILVHHSSKSMDQGFANQIARLGPGRKKVFIIAPQGPSSGPIEFFADLLNISTQSMNIRARSIEVSYDLNQKVFAILFRTADEHFLTTIPLDKLIRK